MALNVTESGVRPNLMPGVIRAGVKRANKVRKFEVTETLIKLINEEGVKI